MRSATVTRSSWRVLVLGLVAAIGGACSLTTPLDGLSGGEPASGGAAGSAGAAGTQDATFDAAESAADQSAEAHEAGADAVVDPATEAASEAGPDGDADGMADADGADAISSDEACTSRSDAECGRYLTCAGDFALSVVYGTIAQCKAARWNRCMARLQAPSTGDTPDKEAQCAADTAALPCPDVLAFIAPQSCKPAQGSTADGAGCWDSAQCASSHCNVVPGSLCGFCAAPLAEGQLCQHDGQCAWPMQCFQGSCRTLAQLNGACSPSQGPCALGLVCTSGACKAAKPLGAACNPGFPLDGCNTLIGLFCASNGTCAQGSSAGLGGLCGMTGAKYVWCEQGAKCLYSAGDNRCALTTTGQACGGDGGQHGPCEAPGGCLNETCTLPNAVACP